MTFFLVFMALERSNLTFSTELSTTTRRFLLVDQQTLLVHLGQWTELLWWFVYILPQKFDPTVAMHESSMMMAISVLSCDPYASANIEWSLISCMCVSIDTSRVLPLIIRTIPCDSLDHYVTERTVLMTWNVVFIIMRSHKRV